MQNLSDTNKRYIDFSKAQDLYGGEPEQEQDKKPEDSDGGKSPGQAENFDSTRHKLDGSSFHRISDYDLANLPPNTLNKINWSNKHNLAYRLDAMGDDPPNVLMRGVLPPKQYELDAFNRGEAVPQGTRHFAATSEISPNTHQQVSDIARNLFKAEQYAGKSIISGGKIYAYTNSGMGRGHPCHSERDANLAAPGDVFSVSAKFIEVILPFDDLEHLTTIQSEDVFRNTRIGRLAANLKDFSQRYPHLESAHALKNVNIIVSALEAKRPQLALARAEWAAKQREEKDAAYQSGAFGRIVYAVRSWW